MKISLLALINIIRKKYPNCTIEIKDCRVENLVWVMMSYGQNDHSLYYDIQNQTIHEITFEWQSLFETAKDLELDRMARKRSLREIDPDRLLVQEWEKLKTGNDDLDSIYQYGDEFFDRNKDYAYAD